MMTQELLAGLIDGEVSFDHFATEVRGDLERFARRVVRRWNGLPPGMDVEDLVQEMLLALYQQLPAYELERGDIKSFVVFRACSCASRTIRRSMAQARLERSYSTGGHDEQAPEQECARLALELTRLVPYDERQRTIMVSLARTGSLDVTTQELLEHPDTAAMFETHDHKRAKHSVYRTARKLAHRAAAMTA